MKLRKWMAALLTFAMLAALVLSPEITPTGDLLGMKAYAAEDVALNEKNFPDPVFREYCRQFDTDENGVLSTEEISDVHGIFMFYDNISTLQGIEYFTALKELSCEYCELTELDVTKNPELTTLWCGANQLTKLDVTKNPALTRLDCGKNQLNKLDVTKNPELTTLRCGANQLTELDVTKNPALTTLDCGKNQLRELNVTRNPALTSLSCYHNKITKLNVSKNTGLEELDCYSNQLDKLDVTKNPALTELDCSQNQLTALDVSACINLKYLDGYNNAYYIGKVADTYDLALLPAGFDVEKTSNWTGAYCDKATKTLYFASPEVTYTYDCGNGETVEFKLIAADNPDDVKPRNVTVKSGKAGRLTVKWDALEGAGRYAVAIYENGNYHVYTDSVTKTSYTIKGLKANKTYEVFVSAFVNGKWSDYSDEVKGTTATQPVNVKAKAKGKGKLVVSWDAVNGATKYAVSIYENGKYHTYTRSKKGTSYKIKGLKSNTTYEVLVQAYVDGKWSSYTTADHVKGKTK